MKKVFSKVLWLTLFISFVMGQDFNVSIYDKYRVKEISYFTPQFTVTSKYDNTNETRDNYLIDSLTYNKTHQKTTAYSGVLLSYYFESEEKVASLRLHPYYTFYKSHYEVSSRDFRSDGSKVHRYGMFLKYSNDRYLRGTSNYIGTSVAVNILRENKNQDSQYEYGDRIKNYDDFYLNIKQDYQVKVLFGQGRTRNVTAVQEALFLINRLKAYNPHLSKLNEQDVVKIAQAIEGKKKFIREHYRSNKYFWASIEAVFDSLGYGLNEMDMYATNYIQESTGLIHFNRTIGSKWDIGLLAEYEKKYSYKEINHQNDGDTTLYDETNWQEDIYLLLNPSYRFYKPLSFKSQITFSVNLFGGAAINNNPVYKQKYGSNAYLRYLYDITDKLLFSTYLTYNFTRWNGDESYNNHEITFAPTISYYLIDFANISFSYNVNHLSQTELDVDLPQNPRETNETAWISLTFGPSAPRKFYY